MEALALKPDDKISMFNKAALLEATTKPDEAKAIYEAILVQDPEFTRATAALANLAEQSGDLAAAEELLSKGCFLELKLLLKAAA